MIYKTLKKVSDVCQLLDKSRYEVTQTNRGVTFTNNGDGTITANGTATGGNATFNLQSSITVVAGHKYLVSTDYTNQVRIQLYTGPNDIFASYNTANVPQIITCINNYNYVYYQIIFYNGVTVSGAILKPQLFDLTEMYGAGNEPTTVEEFRTKFPNELYDYKPYCFVKSYKNCLKVSDVCQLMVYPYSETTLTRYGITFTDNGDGTITANGTSIGFATFVFSDNFNFIAGNKYYVSTPYSVIAYKENGTMDYVQGNILFTWKSNWEIVQVYMQIKKGSTVSNLTFKPQIFDLTEMYGSGNEPTTVEQFKADFPNELYDYKPYSIVPSYKKSLICTTKNLFDKNNVVVGYIDEYGVLMETTDWKTSDFIPIMSNTSYTISGISYVGYAAYYAWYDMNKNFISSVSIKINSQTMISPSGAVYIRVCYKSSVGDGDTLQLEEGLTATEYHPYGYL